MTADTRSTRLRVPAFAKINLSLEVLGLRPDGYHDLRTVFQTIGLHDLLSFSQTAGPFEIRCDDPACPIDRTNLIWRAAQLVWRAGRRAGAPRGVRVRVWKKIPMQAGLGGGSSDAAAALVTLSKIWRVPLSSRQLARLARKLGADVPFFLEGGTALGEGTGDCLTRLPDWPRSWMVLVVPGFGVSTKDAYAWLDQESAADPGAGGVLRRPVLDMREHHHASASGAGVGPRAVKNVGETTALGNDLQQAVAAHYPEISEIVAALRRAGASHAAMSGSGSAVFGVFPTRGDAAAAARGLERKSRRAIVTRTLARREFKKGGLPGKVSIG